MNKAKKIGVLSLLAMMLVGCSCSKVDETTYEKAVNVYDTTDGINFSRVETITVADEDIYTRKKITAGYLFDSNKNVKEMEYIITTYKMSTAGSSISNNVVKYYYSLDKQTLYTQESSVERYKETNVTYNEKFNINVSEGDQMLMIVGNFAPIFKLNEVSEFTITKNNGKAEVSFLAVCPNYESCSSNSELIKYNYVIGESGTIESLTYDIVIGDTTHNIKYTFHSYGSNNVVISFPNDLESYIEK